MAWLLVTKFLFQKACSHIPPKIRDYAVVASCKRAEWLHGMALWLWLLVALRFPSLPGCDASVLFLATFCQPLPFSRSLSIFAALRLSSRFASNGCATVALGIDAPAPRCRHPRSTDRALPARDHQVSPGLPLNGAWSACTAGLPVLLLWHFGFSVCCLPITVCIRQINLLLILCSRS